MQRRQRLRGMAALPMLPLLDISGRVAAGPAGLVPRVRPSDPQWPGASEWESLRQAVAGNLIAMRSPLAACRTAPKGEACRDLFMISRTPTSSAVTQR